MSTGPINPDSNGPTGYTGPIITDPNGPTGPNYIMTMDELLASTAAINAQQNADTASLSPIVSPSASLFSNAFTQWALQGFPALFIIYSVDLSLPAVCADGVTRNIYDYVSYLLNTDLGAQMETFQTKFQGINTTYSFLGNTFRVHVSKS